MRRLLDSAGVRATSRFANVEGRRVHFIEAGRGEPLVLLHGAGGGAANWFRVLPELAESFRVIAPDLPGFGLSDPIDPRPPLGHCIAVHLSGWLDRLGLERCRVAGTSFGGLVAARIASRDPERVDRLVLIASAGLGREMTRWVRALGLPFIGRWALRPTRRGSRWAFRKLMTSDRSRIDPSLEDALVDYLHCSDLAGDTRTMARAYRMFCSPRGQREVLSRAELAALHAPTLLVSGERDVFFPSRHARAAAASIPQAHAHILDGVGHSPNWEAPDELLDVMLPFLAASEPAS